MIGFEPISVQNGGSARVLQNLSITHCDALCKLAGIQTVLQALNGTVHAWAACAWARRPAEDGEADTRPGGRVCLDEGFYLHRQGPAGISSQMMSAAVQGRSSGPIQPAAGISARSTETICGPKLRPPRRPPPPSRYGGLASSQVSGGGGGI